MLGLVGVWLLVGACVQEPAAEGDESGSESSTDTGTDTGDDGDWEVVEQVGTDVGALMSVWGPSPGELFIVGGQPEADGGRVLRGHDDSWEPESVPAGTGMLNWVYGHERKEDRLRAEGFHQEGKLGSGTMTGSDDGRRSGRGAAVLTGHA